MKAVTQLRSYAVTQLRRYEITQLFYYLCFALAGCFQLPAMKSLKRFIVILQKRLVPAFWVSILPDILPADLLCMSSGFRHESEEVLTFFIRPQNFMNADYEVELHKRLRKCHSVNYIYKQIN